MRVRETGSPAAPQRSTTQVAAVTATGRIAARAYARQDDTCRTGLFLQHNFDAVRIVGLAALVEEPSSLQFFTDLSRRTCAHR